MYSTKAVPLSGAVFFAQIKQSSGSEMFGVSFCQNQTPKASLISGDPDIAAYNRRG